MRAIERGAGPDAQSVLSLGVPLLDDALPGGGLLRAAVHEILPERTEWDDGSTTGFTLALTGRLQATAAGEEELGLSCLTFHPASRS